MCFNVPQCVPMAAAGSKVKIQQGKNTVGLHIASDVIEVWKPNLNLDGIVHSGSSLH